MAALPTGWSTSSPYAQPTSDGGTNSIQNGNWGGFNPNAGQLDPSAWASTVGYNGPTQQMQSNGFGASNPIPGTVDPAYQQFLQNNGYNQGYQTNSGSNLISGLFKNGQQVGPSQVAANPGGTGSDFWSMAAPLLTVGVGGALAAGSGGVAGAGDAGTPAATDSGYMGPGSSGAGAGTDQIVNGSAAAGAGPSGMSTWQQLLAKVGTGALTSAVGSGGGGGGGGGSNGSNSNGNGNGLNLGGTLSNLLTAYYGNQASNNAAGQYQNQINQINGLYAPDSVYAKQMQGTLAAQDAASGRTSQYGQRAQQLAANLTNNKAQMLNSANMQQLIGNAINSRNQGPATYLAALNGSNGLLGNNGPLSQLINQYFNGGNGGQSPGINGPSSSVPNVPTNSGTPTVDNNGTPINTSGGATSYPVNSGSSTLTDLNGGLNDPSINGGNVTPINDPLVIP
jgi:hypothetical protein